MMPVPDNAISRRKTLWKKLFERFDKIDGRPTPAKREVYGIYSICRCSSRCDRCGMYKACCVGVRAHLVCIIYATASHSVHTCMPNHVDQEHGRSVPEQQQFLLHWRA